MDTPSTHSWYCEFHYGERGKGENEGQYIVRDEFVKNNVFTTEDEFVPEADIVGLIKEKFGYER